MFPFFEDIIAYMAAGGFVMPPLAVATILLWYALGYRYATLQRGNKRSVRRLITRYRQGYDREPSGIIDTAVVIGLRLRKQMSPEELRHYLDETFQPLEKEAARYARITASIVMVAPLAGLLGTVTGMIETFDSLADMSLFSQSGGIAGGISQALFSTQMGLAVAVPGLVVGRMLKRRERTIIRELAQIKDVICAADTRETGPKEEDA